MASMSSHPAAPVPRGWWIGGLALIAAAVAVVVHVAHLTVTDDVQQLHLVVSLGAGDLVHAFESPEAQVQTSGPGFGLFALPVFALLRLVGSEHQAYVGAAFACLAPLATAVVAASRALGVPCRSGRELANVAVVVLGTPILASYIEALHPADVLATAACLGAFAALARQRTAWAFVLLGFAIATRQWAILALAVLAVLEQGDGRRQLIIGSLGTAVALLVPFLVANPGQTIFVLSADTMTQGPIMAVSLLDLPYSVAYGLSRYVPLVATVVLCGWLLRRRVGWSPEVAMAALAVAFLVRPPLDPGGYLYYAAPGYACFVLLGPRTWRWLGAGAAVSSVLLVRYLLRHRFPVARVASPLGTSGPLRAPGVALAVLTTLVFVAALVAAVAHLHTLVQRSAEAPGNGSGERTARGPADPGGGHRLLR